MRRLPPSWPLGENPTVTRGRHSDQAVGVQRLRVRFAKRGRLRFTSHREQCFSDDEPQTGKPRLRLPDDDGGRTAQSVRRGIRAFAEGCFAAIRNPTAHDGGEMSETDALERLAALSMLAKWVDQATVST